MLNFIKQNKNSSAMKFSAMVFLFISVFLLSCPVVVHADPITFSAGQAFAAYAQAYGMEAGVGFQFDNSSVADRTTIFVNEFDEWQQHKVDVSNGTYVAKSVDTWESTYEDDVEYFETYGAAFINGTTDVGSGSYYTMMRFNQAIADELNQFYNWFLNKLGLNYSHSTGKFGDSSGEFSSPITFSTSFDFYHVPENSSFSPGYWNNYGDMYYRANQPETYYAFVNHSPYPSVVVVCRTVGSCYGYYLNNSYTFTDRIQTPSSSFDSSFSSFYYFFATAGNGPSSVNSDIPFYSDLSSALTSASAFFSTSSSFSSAFIDPYLPTLDVGISIPDVSDSDYIAEPVETVIGIPWDDLYSQDDAIEEIAPLIATQAVSGTFELVEELAVPAPPDVQIPFLPVNLPSFSLGLSGIWHYVREWVGSLRSFMSVCFTVWAGLPYAMVVPVYASAVIVIVLGIYKRFFT